MIKKYQFGADISLDIQNAVLKNTKVLYTSAASSEITSRTGRCLHK